jgi:hypothetical protein
VYIGTLDDQRTTSSASLDFFLGEVQKAKKKQKKGKKGRRKR